MIRIAWEEGRDRAWLARLVRSWGLDAAVGRAREGWEVLVCRDGSVRAAGQLITCGNDPRCTLTISSTLQKGGLAALQREIRTLAGRPCPPQELSLAGLRGTTRQKLAGAAVLLLFGKIPPESCAAAEKRV